LAEMSVTGQKRNLSVGPFLSAFGPKADIQSDIADGESQS